MGVVVYRTTDKIPVRFPNNRVVFISPMSSGQRTELMGMTHIEGGNVVVDHNVMNQAIKWSVKGIEGFDDTYADGSKLELEFDENGHLTEDSLTELEQALGRNKVLEFAAQLAARERLQDCVVEGVTFDFDSVVSAKKKKR